MKLKLFICMTLAFSIQSIDAHGGGLDSSGCHHDRKRGGYHCHRGLNTPPPSTSSKAYSPNLITPSSKTTCKVTIGGDVKQCPCRPQPPRLAVCWYIPPAHAKRSTTTLTGWTGRMRMMWPGGVSQSPWLTATCVERFC